MAHPPRNSSLQPPPVYQFTGSPRRPGQTLSPLPQTIFDDDNSSIDDYNEKTGFTTPESESEKPLAYSYPLPSAQRLNTPQKPFIHYIQNDWRNQSTYGTGQEDDEFCPDECKEIICSRAFKKWMLLYLVLAVCGLLWWYRYYTPVHRKHVASTFLADSLKGRFLDDSEDGYFGSNRRVEFAGMQHLRNLDRNLVPGSGEPGSENRRLVVVGDVHGCVEELEKLLRKVSFNPATDHLISTGDMVSKGPASAEVVDTMIKYSASCVRGNHEDRVLHAYRDHHAPSHEKVAAAQHPLIQNTGKSLKRGHEKDLALAASLSAEQVYYISTCPMILNLGSIPSMGSNVSVVHAGLVPGVTLEKQDPGAVMSMKALDLRNQVPSYDQAPDPSTGPPPRPRTRFRRPDYSNWDEQGRLAVLPWGEVWDTFQDMIPSLLHEGLAREKNPPVPAQNKKADGTQKPINPYKHLEQSSVIYGHNGRAGIVEGKWHYGLDGACFRGGKLAAMVIEEDHGLLRMPGGSKVTREKRVKKKIVSVDCRNYREERRQKERMEEDQAKKKGKGVL